MECCLEEPNIYLGCLFCLKSLVFFGASRLLSDRKWLLEASVLAAKMLVFVVLGQNQGLLGLFVDHLWCVGQCSPPSGYLQATSKLDE